MYDTSHPNDCDTPRIETRTALYPDQGATDRFGHLGGRPKRRFAALVVSSSGGICLAVGFLVERTGFRLNHVRMPHALGGMVEIAGMVLLVTASIAILIVVGLTVCCLWKAVEYGGDQDRANRWLNVATRVVYLASGGSLRGLRRGPAQTHEEIKALPSAASSTSGPRFWESLTRREQTDLLAVAADIAFPVEGILCREGQRGDHIFVIRSGRVKVSVGSPEGPLLVAIRLPGDIVGERAVLRVAERSATVTALEPVTACIILTGDFTVFLRHHPRVLTAIENQVYGRLTENRSLASGIDRYFAVDSTSLPTSLTGQNCTVVLVDVVGYGARARSDQDRRTIRVALYQIVRGTFADADFRLRDCHLEDRGDGALLIIPPPVPTSSVVNHILGDLVDLLRQHNELAAEATRIQMRVALHVGPVVSDAHGVDGRAIIYTARLLEASALKDGVAQSGADLGFITSDFVFDTIIQPSSGPVDPGAYRHLQSQVKNDPIHAWVYLTQAAS